MLVSSSFQVGSNSVRYAKSNPCDSTPKCIGDQIQPIEYRINIPMHLIKAVVSSDAFELIPPVPTTVLKFIIMPPRLGKQYGCRVTSTISQVPNIHGNPDARTEIRKHTLGCWGYSCLDCRYQPQATTQ